MHFISKGWISFKKPNRSTDQSSSSIMTGESTTSRMKNSGNGLFSLASTATTIGTTDIDSGVVSSFTSIEETLPPSNFSTNCLEEYMNKNLQDVYGTFYPFLLNSIPQKVKFNKLLETIAIIDNASNVDDLNNCRPEINGLRIDSLKERTNCLSIEDDYYDTFPIGFTPKISSKIPLSNETRSKLVKFSCFNQFTKYHSNAPVVDLDYGIQPKPKLSRTKKRYNAFKKLELYHGVKFIMKVSTNPNLFDEWNNVEQTDYEENTRLQKLKELFTHWKKYEIVDPKLFLSTPYDEAENFRRRQVRCYGRNNGLYEQSQLIKIKNKYQYSAFTMYRPPTPLNPRDFNEDIFLEEDVHYIQSIYTPDPENDINTYTNKRPTKSAGDIQAIQNERPLIQCRIYSEPTYGTTGDLEFLGTDVVWHKEDFITLSR